MEKKVLTVIADLVASRSVKQRSELQEALMAVLTKTNALNHRAVLSPYTLTLGDEFQAVYDRADHLFRDLLGIAVAIFPHRLRYSLAAGTLVTKINRQQAIGMDGPAFHAAREGMEQLKESSRVFLLSGEIGPYPEVLNSALALVSHSMSGWRKNRFLILQGLLEEKNRQEIAGDVGISLPAFHKNLQAGALPEIVTLFSEIEKLLNSHLSPR
jgi:hypothetical protein